MSGQARGLLALLLPLALGGCLPQHWYQTSAPPVEKLVALVERDAYLAEQLGAPVEVSLVVSKHFERDYLKSKTTGIDRVYLITEVEGSRREALLDLSAENVNGQGWAGTFSITLVGERVLRNGSYVVEGGGKIFSGTFAPDGAPLPDPR